MRDYFGLLEHIRAALLALPIASTVVVGTGCGRVDPIGYAPPGEINTPELALACVLESNAVRAARPGISFTGSCPDFIDVTGNEAWLPDGVGENYNGTLDVDKTEKVAGSDPPVCCYEWRQVIVVVGRPLISEDGHARVADVRGRAWRSGCPAELDVRGVARSLRNYLARAWLRDALAEHASIASFARTTMELLAVGAPRELVRDAQAAGLDEVRHADLCFELAAAYAGTPVGPGRLDSSPPREPSLVRLALDTFYEGCVGETIAALRATRAEAACEVEPVRNILKMIVRDETKHAALAWQTVAWAVAEGGAPVREALRKHARAPFIVAPRATSFALSAHGRLDPLAKHRAAEDAWREIIAPSLAQALNG